MSVASSSDRTPLHWACSYGNKDDVINLLMKGDDINATDEIGWTPLIIASSAGHLDIVKILIDRGAHVNDSNDNGQTALHYAASKNLQSIAEYLLDNGAYVNQRDKMSQTALHRAASKGNVSIMEMLLKRKGIDLNPKDSVGNTPLHLLCEDERWDDAKRLIKSGANIHLKNKEEKTPLDLCQSASVRNSLKSFETIQL